MPPIPKPENPAPQLLLLVGPTASGKTQVAIELCDLLDGEIVSADSMLIYRGLDIGTAKPTLHEQQRARHHLIDLRAPDQEYSAAQWAQDARAVIAQLSHHGKQPIVVGGTGFYINALLRPQLLAGAPPNPRLRAELELLAAEQGLAALHARLQQLDAAAAARLHPNDVMRVSRAIEVAVAAANTPAPANENERGQVYEYSAFALEMPREVLYERINARVEAMQQGGFADEVKHLLACGYGETAALQSLGYKQMRAMLENPARRHEQVEEWKRETRRYAKRQGTWFRHQLDVQWMGAVDGENSIRSATELAEEIAGSFRKSAPGV